MLVISPLGIKDGEIMNAKQESNVNPWKRGAQ